MFHMKKVLLFCCALLLSANAMFAQTSKNWSVGGGLTYGTGPENLALDLRGIYTINRTWRVQANFDYYFVSSPLTNWNIDANANYMLHQEKDFKAYGLAGLDLAYSKVSLGVLGSVSSTEIGINIGAGLEFNTDFGGVFFEPKYTIGNAKQLTLTAGMRFNL